MGNQESSIQVGGQALWDAARLGKKKQLQHILAHEAVREFIDYRDPKYGQTPLMVACQKGRAEVVSMLVHAGAAIDARDAGEEGNTALHYAAYKNRRNVLQLLLKSRCNPHIWNAKGRTALDVARVRERKQAVEVLSRHLMVHQGWLYCRKRAGVISHWRKRWCTLLQSSPDGDRLELATFGYPGDLQPRKVLIVNPSEHTVRPVEKTKWSDHTHMFEFSQSMVFQRMKDKEFSRSQQHIARLVRNPRVDAEREFSFASETRPAMEQWLQCFRRQVYMPSAPPSTPVFDSIDIP